MIQHGLFGSESIYDRLNSYYAQSISERNTPSIYSSEASKLKDDTCIEYSSEFEPQAESPSQQNPVSCSENWRFAGWRLGALIGAFLAIVSLLINLSVIIWLGTHGDSRSGLVEMYRGDCQKVKTMNTWNHLAINIISTLLLGGSNYSMQCLVAPTRKEIDREHARGRFLDIGVPSIRNLLKIPKHKMALWWMLGLSSVPLHLFYNSAFYSSIAAVDYDIFIVTPDFINGAAFNLSDATKYPQNFVDPASVQREISTYQNLTNSECIAAYSQVISTERKTVVIVSSSKNGTANNSLLDAQHYIFNQSVAGGNGWYQPFQWICSDPNISEKITLPAPWTNTPVGLWPTCDVYVSLVQQKADEWAPAGYPADYCLSKPTPQKCSFNANIPIIAAVIGCNALKAIGMLLVAFKLVDRPLITIGDALESFLQTPDPTTKGICWITRQDLQDYITYPLHFPDACFPSNICTLPPAGKEIPVRKRRWLSAASATRWVITSALFGMAIATTGGLLAPALNQISGMGNDAILKLGFGVLQPVAIVTGWLIDNITSPAQQILASVIIANLPQVILSFLYLNLNGVITAMWLAAEWNDFATHRKYLRVSNPSGSQRSTHFLQLPYRIIIPLMFMSGLIHYSISQSIFLAVVSEYDNEDQLVNSVEVASCGYSVLAIIVTMCLTFCLILTVAIIGFRKYDGRIPLVGSNSAAISAACHRPDWDYDAAMQPVQYGVFDEKDINSDPDVGHCCFTSGEVTFVEEGKRYAGIVKRKRIHEVQVTHDGTL